MTIEEIERSLPNGFHDTDLKTIQIDYEKGEVCLELSVWTGIMSQDEELRERMQSGKLTITGLLFCVIEPPDSQHPYQDTGEISYQDTGELWIHDSAPVTSEEMLAKLPKSIPKEAFVHYFYIDNWNSFIFIAAMNARFEWVE